MGNPQTPRASLSLAYFTAGERVLLAKLRREIKKAKDPTPRTPASADWKKAAFVVTDDRIAIDLTRELERAERDGLAVKLSLSLRSFGYRPVVISNGPA